MNIKSSNIVGEGGDFYELSGQTIAYLFIQFLKVSGLVDHQRFH